MEKNAFSCLVGVALSGCAATQLTHNTIDLSHSVQDIVTRQVLYNLSLLAEKPYAIPSQVSLSSGTASTTNSVNPQVSAPFNPATTVATNLQSTLSSAGAVTGSQTQNNVQNVRAAVGATLSATDSWVQNWSYVPVVDPDQIRRLRTLYNFALYGDGEGNLHVPNMEIAKFKSEYPLVRKTQTLSYSDEPPKNSTYCPSLWKGLTCKGGTLILQIPDETFLQRPTCVLCTLVRGDNAHYTDYQSVVLNERIQRYLHSGWLHFDSFDSERDEYLGVFRNHTLSVDRNDRWKLAEFTMFVMSATKDGQNSNGSGPSSSGKTPAGLLSIDATTGNSQLFQLVPGN